MAFGDINWKRASVEGATIVVSILLAFSIDAWWEDRRDRDDEIALLNSLLEEFREIRANVNDIQSFQGTILQSTRRLMALSVDTNPSVSDAELDRLIADQTWISSPENFIAPELNSAILRGDLSLVSNRQLRLQLRSWPAKFTWIQATLAEDMEFTRSVIHPYLRENISLLQLNDRLLKRPGDPTHTADVPVIDLKTTTSHAAVLNDMTFRNILAQRQDILTDILSLARDPEMPQRLDETIAQLEREVGQFSPTSGS